MLYNSQLLIKFWDKVAITNVYLRNRISIKLIIDKKSTSLEQVYIEKILLINHIRVWRCKCIAYINLDSYLIYIRRDKLISKEREAILIRFDSKTIK